MPYRYSEIDRKNIAWFRQDDSRATLLTLALSGGTLRGLAPFEMALQYPVTAIAGRNGTGKTTVLAMAACAYHNGHDGHVPPGRKHPYYTFSDFFIQSADDQNPVGISIKYQFLHNNWRKGDSTPTGRGSAWQSRTRSARGKWNDYSARIHRNVVFLGIDRVVPHSERSVFKTYRRRFRAAAPFGWENDVRMMVGRILGRPYDALEYRAHSKYRLPVVRSRGAKYSGFNMGAGESALFEILFNIHACKDKGGLFVIDEIELGLHEEAQEALIFTLKELCVKFHVQVICTTHSPQILNSLPPEGRFYIERVDSSTRLIPGITTAFATGKLSGHKSAELDVYVEDDIAKAVVEAMLPHDLRQRVRVHEIGSAAAVMRQLAARYLDGDGSRVCAILDGDKALEDTSNIRTFLRALERPRSDDDAKSWGESRVSYLPGPDWPERWVVATVSQGALTWAEADFGVSEGGMRDALLRASLAEAHSEFYVLSSWLQRDEHYIRARMCKHAVGIVPGVVSEITTWISSLLDLA